MLAFHNYCVGLGVEFCSEVTSALHLVERHHLGMPPSQLDLPPAVPGSQLGPTQPFPLSVACTDLATGHLVQLRELAPNQVKLVGSMQAMSSMQAVADSLVGAAVTRIDWAEAQASEWLEQLVHTSACSIVATA